MEVEYEITHDDLYAFQWRAAFESPRARRVRRLAYLVWLLAIALFALVPAIGADGFTLSRISVTFILVSVLVFFALQWCLERWLMRRAIRHILKDERPDRGVLGRHRVVLDEDGVRESTAVGESRTTWAGIDRVEEGPEYIYLYTSPAAAHVIPRRAFGDPMQADAFYQFALARRAAAG